MKLDTWIKRSAREMMRDLERVVMVARQQSRRRRSKASGIASGIKKGDAVYAFFGWKGRKHMKRLK